MRGMQVVEALVPASLEDCWQAFASPQFWIAWVPGLRGARVLSATAGGLPDEVAFDYAGGVSYVLRYRYDLDAHTVRWEPRPGDRGGVRGFARFEPRGGAQTFLVYALEHDGTRTSPEAELDDPRVLVDGFAAYLRERARS